MKALAEQVGVSKKTVQRELEAVNRPLKKYGIVFCTRAGLGVWLEGSPKDKSVLLELLSGDSIEAPDRQNRRRRLILELLQDKSVRKLYHYAALLRVSETTVNSDLEAVEGWLSGFRLRLVRKPGRGVEVEGSEGDFRRALGAFARENLNMGPTGELVSGRGGVPAVPFAGSRGLGEMLDEAIMRRVISCMQSISNKRLQNMTDNAYTELVIHIIIAVTRILDLKPIELSGQQEYVEQDEEFALAGVIAGKLEAEFHIVISKEEQAELCLHIKGAKVQLYTGDGGSSGSQLLEYRKLLTVVHEMIDRFDPVLSVDLKQDQEFVVQGLATHLQPTLVRLKNHMEIKNPLLDYIKREYGETFERCREAARVIEERYGFQVPEAEVGFLTIHFGAAVIRLKGRWETVRQVHIGMVCASGIGISRLILSKLRYRFKERAEITAYGTYDLGPPVLQQLDFLVSTVPLTWGFETLEVGLLPGEEDMERIEKRVRFYEHTPKKVLRAIVREIYKEGSTD